jgi:hypothetical protein
MDHMNSPTAQDPATPSRLAAFVDAHGRALVLIFLTIALAGLIFSFRLPISIFPQTDFPRIIIMVNNGIAPVDVQMLTVTRPIEESIRIVPGITNVRSVTSRGLSEISVYFRWDVDILHALHLVQGRISQLMPNMPPEARFYVNRLTFSVFPMIGFSVTSPTRNLAELWDLAYYNLAPPSIPVARGIGDADCRRPPARIPCPGEPGEAQRIRASADTGRGGDSQREPHRSRGNGTGKLSSVSHHSERLVEKSR